MDYKFKNLVFEGGGVKGIAYCGALKQLEESKILSSIKRVAGTSAGAITAGLLSVGYAHQDIERELKPAVFKSFMDDSLGYIRDTYRLLSKFGWYKGDAFQEWFEGLIQKKTGNKKITFGEVAEESKKNQSYRSLYVTGTNLNKKITEFFDEERTPNMPVAEGVRISMSIPLFFCAVKLNNNYYVDGGLYYNYPINIFDNARYAPLENSLPAPYDPRPGAVYNKETLGLRVDTKDEINSHLKKTEEPPQEIRNLKDYAMVLVGGLTDNLNKLHIHKNDWHRTIYIDSLGVGTTDFGLEDRIIQKLIQSGRDGTINYLRWFDNPAADEEQPINK